MHWPKLIAEIKSTGMAQSAIAREIGVADSTISELLSEKISEIRWSKGNALVALHAERCGSQSTA